MSFLSKWFSVPNTPYALGWDEWAEWKREAKKKYPIRFFLSDTLDIALSRAWRRWIHDPWYWLKCRVWHRYNVVRIKTLPPTWCDRDCLLLHACFQILCDFIEQEEPWEFSATDEKLAEAYKWTDENGDARVDDKRLDDWRRIRSLYSWWKGALAHRLAIGDYDESDPLDHEFRETCTEKLKELIELRGHYWT